MKKVLVVIVNYGTEQLNYLQKAVNELQSFKNYSVDIVVHTDVPVFIKGVEEKIFDLLDYQYLPLTCKITIWDRRNDYDVFVYTENDHLIKEHHIDKYLEYQEILPFNRIAGLIQYEETEEGERWYPAYHKKYDWDYDSVELHEGKLFAHFTNLHQACFIITRWQLLLIDKKHTFINFFGHSEYSVKCKVNTDIYQFCGMKKLICISDFKDNLVHHLPNLYAKGKNKRLKLGSSEITMKKALAVLFQGDKEHDLIIKKYKKLSNVKSDINEHLKTLKMYAEKCNHITEAGVRWVVSTWALLAGRPKKLISYDIKHHENIEEVKSVVGNRFEFKLQSFPDKDMEETDLLFIDTWHVYSQLKKELAFANKVRGFIILHDTTTFGEIGEDGGEGLQKALNEFLQENKNWKVKEVFTNNNGLTVLEKVNIKYSVIVPTMWYANKHFLPMLEKYQNNDLISEILIINNRKGFDVRRLSNLDKVKVLNNGKNLFVNPSWNLGVSEAKEQKILIINDDITIDKFDEVLNLVEENLENSRILGFHVDSFSDVKVKEVSVQKMPFNFKAHGFGTFMAMFKSDYEVIPDDMKVWSGDRLQFARNTPYAIRGFKVETEMSTTSRKLDLSEYRKMDVVNYKKHLAELI